MDSQKIQQKRRQCKGPPSLGEQSAAIFGGVALHGENKPAIDADAVRKDWRRIWRSVLSQVTPIQLQALRDELDEVAR